MTVKTSMTLLVLAFAAACAKSPGSGDETTSSAGSVSEGSILVGPRWRLVELDGQPSIAGGGAREPHLIFSRSEGVDRVGGATGCNSMGGRYEIDGDGIGFSDLFSTKMACAEEDRMRQETRFVSALERADRYSISGDTLTLHAGDAVVARFVKT
jgi:heat shock protein HslJ